MTVNDLILAALRRIRVVSGADPADGDTITDALARFNDWIDDLKNQDFLVLNEVRLTWTIVPGQASYTVGPGLQVNVPDVFQNSNDIHNVGYIDTSISPIYEYQLGPCLTEDAYASIPQKAMTSSFPYYWYYNAAGTLVPWPVPTRTALLGVIYYSKTLAEMTLNTVLTLPNGYRRFLRDGLALELAPEFHVDDPGVLGPLRASAEEAKGNIKRKTRTLKDLTPPDMVLMFGANRGGNIYTGP